MAEAAVTGEPDDDLGERIVAWMVVEGAGGRGEQELADHVARLLTPHKRPREVRYLDELPRNAMGKVTKKTLGAEPVKRAPSGRPNRGCRADAPSSSPPWSRSSLSRRAAGIAALHHHAGERREALRNPDRARVRREPARRARVRGERERRVPLAVQAEVTRRCCVDMRRDCAPSTRRRRRRRRPDILRAFDSSSR